MKTRLNQLSNDEEHRQGFCQNTPIYFVYVFKICNKLYLNDNQINLKLIYYSVLYFTYYNNKIPYKTISQLILQLQLIKMKIIII